MNKQVLLPLLFAICIHPQLLFAQTACCDDPACRDKAMQLVTAIGKASELLGVYPTNQPVDFNGKKRFLDSLKTYEAAKYNAIKKAAKQINDWEGKDVSRHVCLSREYANLTEDQLHWVNYFITVFYNASFRSPEFRKGFGLLVHAGIGASSLFKTSEQFASLGGLLLSYTFVPRGQTAGGHIRAMIGPGLYYSATKTYLLLHPRIEFRIKDIGNELTNIGCIKLIAQGGFQKDIQLAGLGIGAEISRFHVQLTENYLFNDSVLALQIGIGYSFVFKKE